MRTPNNQTKKATLTAMSEFCIAKLKKVDKSAKTRVNRILTPSCIKHTFHVPLNHRTTARELSLNDRKNENTTYEKHMCERKFSRRFTSKPLAPPVDLTSTSGKCTVKY